MGESRMRAKDRRKTWRAWNHQFVLDRPPHVAEHERNHRSAWKRLREWAKNANDPKVQAVMRTFEREHVL